jgi:hypothetical protein
MINPIEIIEILKIYELSVLSNYYLPNDLTKKSILSHLLN